MTTKTSVQKAAELMDEVKPDWHTNIDFNNLRMWDPNYCIAGQNGLYFMTMIGKLHAKEGNTSLYNPFGGSDKVIPYWQNEVNKRLNPQPVRLRDKALLVLSACLPF